MERLHIVGQGVAGTALAWQCQQRGVSFRIYDEPRASTASKVAAGLVTPIAGQRLTLTQGWSFLPEMESFYRDVSSLIGTTFYHRHETVRYLANEVEATRWKKRVGDPVFEAELLPGAPSLASAAFHAPTFGAFRMKRAGFLKVNAWLEASREWFLKDGLYEETRMTLDDCDPAAGTWVFANGPWLLRVAAFDWLPMRFAHGDILTLSIPDLGEETRIFSGTAWLLPLGEGLWRAGSTYEAVGRPETQPSVDGRALVEANIQKILRCPYDVIDHVAAVRPVTLTRFPTMGRHPGKAHLAWFGGFSSKGVLTAPSYARQFLDHLLEGLALPDEVGTL